MEPLYWIMGFLAFAILALIITASLVPSEKPDNNSHSDNLKNGCDLTCPACGRVIRLTLLTQPAAPHPPETL
jgi:hypothetical protein